MTVAYVIERFGRYHRTLDTRPRLLVPGIDRVRARVDLSPRRLEFPPQPVITADNLVVSAAATVWCTVTDPVAATYEISNYVHAVEQLAVTALRSIGGELPAATMVESRLDVNRRLLTELTQYTGRWGVRVDQTEITELRPQAR
ncbi:SPFH domain-containing protein [Dactylosporangium sp. NPDC051541]|uniref:SPFH domain-containing protein n=1 Tax=Dactylosporangium sp. NPDC051541 TaxID=3363977 RepID=UPI0037AC8529